MRLQARVILSTVALVAVVVILIGGLSIYILRDTTHTMLGENALDVARTVSRMPQVRHAMQDAQPSATVQPLAEMIRQSTGAAFVLVGVGRGALLPAEPGEHRQDHGWRR